MRLFIALMPPTGFFASLADLMGGVGGARWQRPEQIHLTLRFIGEASETTAAELADLLPGAVRKAPPVAISGVGFFGAPDRPNALWVRASPREGLTHLHDKIDRLCQRVGLAPDPRAFLPHVTVARLSRSAGPIEGWLALHAGFSLPAMAFPRCSLVESVPTDSGRHYAEIASVDLE